MKIEKFRAWMIPNCPGKPATVEVTTLRDVMIVFDTLVAIRINLEERDLPVWEDDVSGLECFNPESEEWDEFYDKDGEDIEYYYSIWSDEDQINDPQIFDQKLEDIVGI